MFLTIMKIYANWKERKRILKEYDEQAARKAASEPAPEPETSQKKDG